MSNGSERLDRIEARLEESSLATDRRLEELAVRVEETTANVNKLAATVNQLATEAREDRARIDKIATEAKADRVVMYEMLDQLTTVRDENKRILDYLFGQQRGNGHGDQPQT